MCVRGLITGFCACFASKAALERSSHSNSRATPRTRASAPGGKKPGRRLDYYPEVDSLLADSIPNRRRYGGNAVGAAIVHENDLVRSSVIQFSQRHQYPLDSRRTIECADDDGEPMTIH